MVESARLSQRIRRSVLDVPIDVLSWADAVDRIFHWAEAGESRTVCICNVHSVVTARSSPAHAEALAYADLATPDGAPIAWMLRWKGHRDQQRINGPDLMSICCRKASDLGTKIFLYGATPSNLRRLEERLRSDFPGLDIVGAISPPFRELSPEEDDDIVATINQSGARIVWVGLGCPKQEAWLKTHAGKVKAVMIGVGAAFDFHAGAAKRAPHWMRTHGLEWLHRLMSDPRRLASRYMVGNSVFLAAAAREMLFARDYVHDR